MKAELCEAAMDAAYEGGVAFSAYEAKVCLSSPMSADDLLTI